MRRTKEQILEDNEFTCSNSKCKKQVDEIWKFTPYGNEARQEEYIKDNGYCEKCFHEKDI